MIIDGFDGLSLQQAGIMCLRSQQSWGARFRLTRDVRRVFPYLNAALEGARYEKQPEHIRFVYEGVQCTLYPDELVAAPFADREQAQQYFRRLSVFKKPLATHEIYPVFDADGALISTVTLEINQDDLPPVKADGSRHDKPHEDAGSAHPPVNRDEKDVTAHPLTNRETEILRLVAAGETNTAISKKLCISPHTVKSHVIHIFNKLGVGDRTQAAVIAIRRHLI